MKNFISLCSVETAVLFQPNKINYGKSCLLSILGKERWSRSSWVAGEYVL